MKLHARLLFVLLSAPLLRPSDAAAQINSSSFGGVTWYSAGANNAYALAVGDLNNDGFVDIVVSSQHYLEDPTQTYTGVGIFINDGSGGFHLASRYPTDGISSAWQSVKIADMDGDGKPDLVVLNSGFNGTCLPPACSPRSVSVMRGNGDGTFQKAVSHLLQPAPSTQLSINKLTVADVNGDGKPDVLVADTVSYAPFAFVDNFRTGVSVLINHGDGTFDSDTLYDAGGTLEPEDVIAADVNGDGFPDIIVANACSQSGPTTPASAGLCVTGAGTRLPGTIAVLLGNGNGTFQHSTIYASGGVVPGSVAAADLNQDGNLDLLVTNGACFNCAGTTVAVLFGNGDGTFQAPVNDNDGAKEPVSIAVGDVDGDGRPDVAVMNRCAAGLSCDGSSGTLSLLPGNGDGTLQAPAIFSLWSTALGSIPNTVLLADLNNDGKPDVVIGAWTAVGVLLNRTPRGATVNPTSLIVPSGGGTLHVDVAFEDQATPWSATTTTPWITIGTPNGGSTSGSLSFTVAANTGAARTGTLTVALQTITVSQDAFVDVTPPTVTPPASTTIYATVAAGATPGTAPALAAFLAGATAADDGPTVPTAHVPTLSGGAVTSTTVFALGANSVTFSFEDGAGNVGTATSVVTVVGGRPSFSVGLAGVALAGAGQQRVTLTLTNTGTGNALNVNVALSSLRTLAGTGAATLASGLPATTALLGPGQSMSLPILANVPATVLRLALSLALTTTDYTGTLFTSAATQTIFPIR